MFESRTGYRKISTLFVKVPFRSLVPTRTEKDFFTKTRKIRYRVGGGTTGRSKLPTTREMWGTLGAVYQDQRLQVRSDRRPRPRVGGGLLYFRATSDLLLLRALTGLCRTVDFVRSGNGTTAVGSL